MAAITKEYIKLILTKVTSEHDIQNWRYTQGKFENIAQNYFGIIVPVVLFGEHKGKEVKIQLVLKLAPTDERYRVSGAVTLFFAREIFVYSVLFKFYHEIQANIPTELHYIIPCCYYVQTEYCNEAIAMQNMIGDGYIPYTKEMFLKLDHITVALKSLAKLHALSFILKNKKPDLYNEISETCVPLTESSSKRYLDIMRDRLDKAMKTFDGTKYIPLLQLLKSNSSIIFESVVTSVERTCICHGDIWKENILFKYKDDKPLSACLIDYQSTRISCAAFDTLYLILSSTNTELRQSYYHQLLDIYYQTFDEMLEAGGLKSQNVYSRQMLDQDLKVVSPACVITANCALWLSNGLQEEGHVRSKVVWTTQEEKNKALNKYKEIVKAIIDDCCSYGYMTLNCNGKEIE